MKPQQVVRLDPSKWTLVNPKDYGLEFDKEYTVIHSFASYLYASIKLEGIEGVFDKESFIAKGEEG